MTSSTKSRPKYTKLDKATGHRGQNSKIIPIDPFRAREPSLHTYKYTGRRRKKTGERSDTPVFQLLFLQWKKLSPSPIPSRRRSDLRPTRTSMMSRSVLWRRRSSRRLKVSRLPMISVTRL